MNGLRRAPLLWFGVAANYFYRLGGDDFPIDFVSNFHEHGGFLSKVCVDDLFKASKVTKNPKKR